MIEWSTATFTADADYIVTIVGKLQAPHTMTITKELRLHVQSICSTASLSYTPKKPLPQLYYNLGVAPSNPTLNFGPFNA